MEGDVPQEDLFVPEPQDKDMVRILRYQDWRNCLVQLPEDIINTKYRIAKLLYLIEVSVATRTS